MRDLINELLVELKKNPDLYHSRPGKSEFRLLKLTKEEKKNMISFKNVEKIDPTIFYNEFCELNVDPEKKNEMLLDNIEKLGTAPIYPNFCEKEIDSKIFTTNLCDSQIEKNESEDMFKIAFGMDSFGNQFIETDLDQISKEFIFNVRTMIQNYFNRDDIYYDTSQPSPELNDDIYVHYPNKPTLLIGGDVKPATYKNIWNAHQLKLWKHMPKGLWVFGRDDPHHGKYKGQGFELICPKGYEALGSAMGSRLNLDTKYNELGTGNPIGQDFKHVCVPSKCVETINNNSVKIKRTWDTHNAKRKNIFTGSKYRRLILHDIDSSDKYPKHNNSYNLFRLTRGTEPVFKRIKDECISQPQQITINGTKDELMKKDIVGVEKEGFKNGQYNEDPYTFYIDSDKLDDPLHDNKYMKVINQKIKDLKDEKNTLFSKLNNNNNNQNLKKKLDEIVLELDIYSFIQKFDNYFFRDQYVQIKYDGSDPNLEKDKNKRFISKYIFNEDLNELELDLIGKNDIPASLNKSIVQRIFNDLKNKNKITRLQNPNEEYVKEEYLDLIGYLDSLPFTTRYSNFKYVAKALRLSIDNSLKNQGLYRKTDTIILDTLGLGWQLPKRKRLEYIQNNIFKIKKYSSQHFFYVPSKGYIYLKNINNNGQETYIKKFYFELDNSITLNNGMNNYDNYILKKQEQKDTDLILQSNNNIINIVNLEAPNRVQNNLFKIILTGDSNNDKQYQQVRIMDLQGKFIINGRQLELKNCGNLTNNQDFDNCDKNTIFYIKNNIEKI